MTSGSAPFPASTGLGGFFQQRLWMLELQMWVTDTCRFKIKNLKEMLEMLMCLELACAHDLLPPPLL